MSFNLPKLIKGVAECGNCPTHGHNINYFIWNRKESDLEVIVWQTNANNSIKPWSKTHQIW
jgi:hypothetical protein